MLLIAIGLALLLLGAELLVRGASRLAATVGLSPLVVGLTVVAYGTSAPELAVSVQSALGGQADIALGNVVGSNVFNVLFILGASAVITPLVVARRLVRLDVPLLIAVSFATWVLALDGRVGRLDGLLLVSGAVVYTAWLIREGRKETRREQERAAVETASPPGGGRRVALNLLWVLVGLGLLVAGSRWFVEGAVEAARTLGLSELVIGLTIIAAGTSLPEVATSLLAAFRGERDIAVGNVIGSNIFNLMAVLGGTSVVAPEGIEIAASALTFDIPVMIGVALACLPIFFTGYVIARWEGGVFMGYYGLYTAYLVLYATRHDALTTYSWIVGAFLIPLTALTLGVLAVRALRGGARWVGSEKGV
jgi:cation:H+ antiporter